MTDPAPAVPDTPTAADMTANLMMLLSLRETAKDRFEGAKNPYGRGRVFGGQVVAQALIAAGRTVEPGKTAHSLHAYFVRAGDENHPIAYTVERDHDGRSFSARRVTAIQKGRPILTLSASFHTDEAGFAHQDPMPDAPPPEDCVSDADYAERHADRIDPRFLAFARRARPVELRHVPPVAPFDPGADKPERMLWLRASAPFEAPPAIHAAALAYASDMALLSTAMGPHAVSWMTGELQSASLDHAVWLHGPVDLNDWHLYAMDSPFAGGARGFNRGRIFARDGRLVASVAQEGLVRPRKTV